MANTNDLYSAVEELKDYAVGTFSRYENNGDLDELISDLNYVVSRATAIEAVTFSVRDSLEGLAGESVGPAPKKRS